MKKFLLIAALINTCHAATAQECKCSSETTIGLYDFQVNIGPAPAADTREAQQYKRALSILKGFQFMFFNRFGDLFKSKCISYFNATDAAPEISGRMLSTPYNATGEISKKGDGYLLHYEVRSGCSNKLVTAIDFPFNMPGEQAASDEIITYVTMLASQAIEGLLPLEDKINAFESREKTADTRIVVEGATISLTPARTKLAPGESTDVELKALDCKGEPIQNMLFSLKGLKTSELTLTGTEGGTTNTANVTTDAQGKAKFKFTKGNTPVAVIRANGTAQYPWGCNHYLTGSTAFGNMVNITIRVEQNGSEVIGGKFADKDWISGTINQTEQRWMSKYKGEFYVAPTTSKDLPTYFYSADLPEGSKTYVIKNSGTGFYSNGSMTSDIISVFGLAEKAESGIVGNHSAQPVPTFGLNIKNNEITNFTLEISYKKTEEEFVDGANISIGYSKKKDWTGPSIQDLVDQEYIAGEMLLGLVKLGGKMGSENPVDEKVVINTRKITNPNSPYKTEYIITYNKKIAQSMKPEMAVVKSEYDRKEETKATITILSPY